LLVIAAISALLGYPILKVLKTLVWSSFRSFAGFKATIRVAIPLVFTAYAFAIPFKIKFFNVGGWGQMLFGAGMTGVAGLLMAGLHLPAAVMLPALLLTAILAGGLYGLMAGYLKAEFDINPIVSAIMLNYVGFQFVGFICAAPRFLDPRGGHPQTMPLPEGASLGFVAGVPHSLIAAVLLIVFMQVLMGRTTLGYQINAVGYNAEAAQAFGIDFRKTIMATFFIGGACAGLGGGLEIMNIHNRLLVGFADIGGANFGVLGVLAALVVAGRPLAVPLSAFLMSVLLVGADRLQRTMQIPVELVFLLQAIIVLSVVISRARLSRGK
jgi:ABC-type uncharacterized transport system permease subunit